MDNRFKFTKSAIEALPLPPVGKRATYYDTKVPKLALRVTASGSKTFYVIRRNGREMLWLKLGPTSDMTIEQAQKGAEAILGEFAKGLDPAEARRAGKAELTVGEFFRHEYSKRHGTRQRSWRDIMQRYRDYLERPLGARKLSTVTREMVSRILSDMDSAGKAGSTVNNVRALISSIFSKAIEWGFASDNPVRGTRTRKTVKRDRFLQADELPRFFAALQQEPNHTIRDYFLIALLTGARRSNVLAMRWSDVQLEEGIWRIPRTKNGDPQNVTLSPEATDILRQRLAANRQARDPSAFVFPGGGKSGHLVEPKAGWKRIFDQDELFRLMSMIESAGHRFELSRSSVTGEVVVGGLETKLKRARAQAEGLGIDTRGVRIPDLRIHDLRRTLGSWQAKMGASLVVIGKSLNHRSTQTTAIYSRLDLDPVRSSVNAATAAMLSTAGGAFRPSWVEPTESDANE